MQDQVEAMSKIPDMKTAYAGNYLTLILPIHDLKKRGEHIFFYKTMKEIYDKAGTSILYKAGFA
jgi:hypothetical protein